jgi:hypothetical protein
VTFTPKEVRRARQAALRELAASTHYVTAAEVAELVPCDPRTLRNLLANDTAEPVGCDRCPVYRRLPGAGLRRVFSPQDVHRLRDRLLRRHYR